MDMSNKITTTLGVLNLKKILVYFLIFIFSVGIVFSDSNHDFSEAKKLIDAKTPCDKLTEKQLELIGDYLMEQIHPGESHELMDKMMGGEGSESLRSMHVAMARRGYCNDTTGMGNYGMMGMMMGKGMMNSNFGKTGYNYGGLTNMPMANMMGYGMMGQGYDYWNFVNFLSIVLIIGLTILVYLWIIKVWKDLFKKSK